MVEEKLMPMVETVCLSADQPQVIFNENTYVAKPGVGIRH